MAVLKSITLEVHDIRPTWISYGWYPDTDEVEINAAYIGVDGSGMPVHGVLTQGTVHLRVARMDIPESPRDGLTFIWTYLRDIAMQQEGLTK